MFVVPRARAQIVMRGLDPRIHLKKPYSKKMDGRVI
jgi:hypothetical protein